jgi:hypothetical protein
MASLPPTMRTIALRQKLAILSGHSRQGRSGRFLAKRSEAPPPDFASVCAVPAWMMMDSKAKSGIAQSVAVLAHRQAIDRELSGKKLGALADVIGHDRMDALCDCPVPPLDDRWGQYAVLPRPEDLETFGASLLEAALPLALKSRFPDATDDAAARALVTIASDIWKRTEGQTP